MNYVQVSLKGDGLCPSQPPSGENSKLCLRGRGAMNYVHVSLIGDELSSSQSPSDHQGPSGDHIPVSDVSPR